MENSEIVGITRHRDRFGKSFSVGTLRAAYAMDTLVAFAGRKREYFTSANLETRRELIARVRYTGIENYRTQDY